MTPNPLSDPRESAPTAATRIVALADACVLCGLCLPHCPTYALDRVEGESPRGRIMLMKGLAEARILPEPAAIEHLDHCLACRNCEQVCPAQVRYGELLLAGRAAQRDRVRVGLRQRAMEWLLPRRRLLAASLRTASLLRGVFAGPWRRLPPSPKPGRFDPYYPALETARGRVGLFLGCLGPHHDAAAARAAIRLLTRLGWDVELPTAQTCCGAAHRHAGASASADALAQHNQAAFGAAPSDGTTRAEQTSPYAAILTLASGCHESVAASFSATASAPVRDALEFIASDERLNALRFRAAAPGARVALHLPCTQRNVTRSAGCVAPLLKRIPELDLAPLPETGCCGAAGSHMLTEPARADALRAPLLDAMSRSGAATLCSANVGCRMHLAVGIEQCGLALRVRHPLELLAEHLQD